MKFKVKRDGAVHNRYKGISRTIRNLSSAFNRLPASSGYQWEVSFDERLTHVCTGESSAHNSAEVNAQLELIDREDLILAINSSMLAITSGGVHSDNSVNSVLDIIHSFSWVTYPHPDGRWGAIALRLAMED